MGPVLRSGFFLLVLLCFSPESSRVRGADPTDRFTPVPLTNDNFLLQKPYNEPLNARYSYQNGVRRFWIFTNDKPFKPDSDTRPRTEVRIKVTSSYHLSVNLTEKVTTFSSDLFRLSSDPVWSVKTASTGPPDLTPTGSLLGLDYTSGVHQFEGYAYVPKGTSGVTIMQIFGAQEGKTTLQLRIYDGEMRYYRVKVVDTDLYDRWFRLNVIHDVDQGRITVFIDGVQKFVVNDRGPGDLYFKFGAYAALTNSSNYMESRWKQIKVYKKQ